MKWKFFHHLSGGEDGDADRLYTWHILARTGARMEAGLPTDHWKRTVDDYTAAARALHQSMRDKGYDDQFPVPVDPNGELLGGAHRVACALALGMSQIPVAKMPDTVWAPRWDYAWFLNAGAPQATADGLVRIFEHLTGDDHS